MAPSLSNAWARPRVFPALPDKPAVAPGAHRAIMGEASLHSPALLLLAAFSRHGEALDWTRRRAVAEWGPLALESPVFEFRETQYYERTMGTGLRKVFFLCERLFDPSQLPGVKLQTNAWEQEYALTAGAEEPRPLNLDPGYLTLAKLVLASTKDHSQRLYLAEGIYAEVTLYYSQRRWQAREWTYADYRRADYQEFFSQGREYLHARLREAETA